jgi:hypothetical protein
VVSLADLLVLRALSSRARTGEPVAV